MVPKFSKFIFSIKTRILQSKLTKLYVQSEKDVTVDSISHLNFRKRQELFTFATTHCPFYQEKFKGVPALESGIQSEEDFLAIPPLTRDELRANFNGIKAKKVSSLYYRKASTSGSTGPPVSVIHDKRNPETPIRWRILKWWGVKPWENQAFIYRFKKPFWTRVLNHLMWWPTKRVFLAAAQLTPEKLNSFITEYNRIEPSLLQGYVDVVFEFALYLLDNDIKIHPPKVVWVTSAPLFEEQREIMQRAFGAPVCDQYGNTEILLIAAECPEQNGLHMMQDTVHVEFVDENNQPVPPNTSGRILLTDLTNYAFPLIRYEIGDEGKYRDHSCPCGRPLALMDNVRGRQAKIIETPSGLKIRGEHIMAMFDGHMKVFKQIQLIQEEDYSVHLDYVPRVKQTGHVEALEMSKLLEQRARGEIKVSIREKATIQRVNNKMPLIINLVK